MRRHWSPRPAVATSPRSPSSTRDGIGGACVLWDCVPSKTFIASTGVRTELRRAPRSGVRHRDSRTPRSRCRRSTTVSRRWPRSQSADIGRPVTQRGGHPRRRPRRARRRHARHGRAPRQGHHTGRLDERAEGRRRADRHRRQPPRAAQREARRRANPELAPALRPRPSCPNTSSSSGPVSPEPSSVNAYTELGVTVTVVASRDQILPHEDSDAAAVLEEAVRRARRASW